MMRARRVALGALGVVAVAGLSLSAAGGQAPASEASLVVRAGSVVTMDATRRVLSPGAVAMGGGRILAVGDPDDVAARFRGVPVLDLGRDILMPGLVNTHGHVPMVLYRGLADDLPLMDWLERFIFPAEARTVSPDFVRAGAALGILEMLRSGTTTFTDMYYFEEESAQVTHEAGLRAVLGQSVIQFPVPDAQTPAEGLARAEKFIQAWRGDPLITPAVAPHAMYTLDAATLTAARDLARRYEVPLLIHLAETQAEATLSQERHRMSPTRYLDSLDFWGPTVLAAHGVWLDDVDVRVLADRGVAVSHNPESNMKLASGIAPVPALRAAGVTVGIGTDGAASNNDLDMFEAMRQAALLHKVASGDPQTLPAGEALAMATIDGARALGLDDETGSLEVGKQADLISVGIDAAHLTPLYDPVSHLVYAARGTDVRTSIVAGRLLMQDGRVLTVDERAILESARRWRERVRDAVR